MEWRFIPAQLLEMHLRFPLHSETKKLALVPHALSILDGFHGMMGGTSVGRHTLLLKGIRMSQGFNPYEPPKSGYAQEQPSYGDDFKGPWKMDYFGVFNWMHANPNWFNSSLLAGLCMLIPIVGPIVCFGFMMESASCLHLTNGKYQPKFDFGRFSNYLGRGVGPFLVGLVGGIIQMIFMFTLLFALGAAIAVTVQAQPGPPGLPDGFQPRPQPPVFLILLVYPLMFSIGFVAYAIMYPLQLRSGLMSNIGEGFNLGWGIEFLKRTWLEMFLKLLCLMLFSFAAAPIVILTCFLGIIPVWGYVFHVMAYYAYQLYRVHLSRGGKRVQMSNDLPQLQ
jgi:Protein of unknown function (DUF4013)